jgi:hypothetical protein
VVKVVVAFAQGQERCERMVARCEAVVVRLVSEVMSQAVDTKGSMVNNDKSAHARKEESTL